MAENPNEHDQNKIEDPQLESSQIEIDDQGNLIESDPGEESSGINRPSGRSASVQFARKVDPSSKGTLLRMDTAHQSLADALKITYNFLQIGMLVLVGLFLLSGLQKINEGERGIEVRFGKPTKTNIEPGAHPTWPYPFGELIRIEGGTVEVPLAEEFMSDYAGSASADSLLVAPLDGFNSNRWLNPTDDNSMITADLNIAHAQWTVNYHRSDHLEYVENILPAEENRIVVLSVRRAVVLTVAELEIDDLLKSSAEAISANVRRLAQESLDQLESGITIDRVVLVRKTPPLSLSNQFASVQSSAQNAGKEKEDALLLRDQYLNKVAGRAAPILISMIDDYEQAIELGDSELAAQVLNDIDTVLQGGDVEYEGQSTLGMATGEVSEILTEARSSASTRVSEAIAELDQFYAKLAQFEANPRLMIARDWSEAMSEFLKKDFVTTMYLPEGTHAELLLNADPDLERERDRLRKRAETAEAQRQRRLDAERDFFRSRRGIDVKDEE